MTEQPTPGMTVEATFEMLAARLSEDEFTAVLENVVQPAMLVAYSNVAEPFLREVHAVVKALGIQTDDYSRGYIAGLQQAVSLFPTPT